MFIYCFLTFLVTEKKNVSLANPFLSEVLKHMDDGVALTILLEKRFLRKAATGGSMTLVAIDGNHRMTLAQQLGKTSISCKLLLLYAPATKEHLTLDQLAVLQSGKNIMDNIAGNIGMISLPIFCLNF